ncbi:inositol-trisphosphate 3-kinase B [Pungitius pungitius]|uniref:inositol-trisphosphate 3-kinase B n=1 Tax=Pungitius pungitius TaxID=134920 RepID=UPI002E126126
MDTTDQNPAGGTETHSQPTVAEDFSAALSDEMHQQMTIGENPSGSGRRHRVRSRPRLKSTKSFPPYSQCIGGLGEDGEGDGPINPDPSDGTRKHENPVTRGTEEREHFELSAKRARDEAKAKWRMRRKERLWGSHEADTDGWERARWSGKRSVEGSGGETECVLSPKSSWKHWRGRNSGLEAHGKEEQDGERKMSPMAAAELLQVSSTSSCSSVNFSSAESDEVFSEGEDVGSKRMAFRKCRSWKAYMTMMHWSLRRQSSWVQLAGHQGSLQLSEGGEVLKLYSEVEANCLDCLMRDPLRPFVPQYHGLVTKGELCYIRLEDLLSGLRKPVIMDCKMGVRTYQEEELVKARTNATPRSDMYQKMVKIDPSAPSAEEHEQGGVTKSRYLQWKDTTSSTSTLGFRIEGIMTEDGSVQRDFRKIMTLAQVTEALLFFTRRQLEILKAYHSRLLALSDALKNSLFFRTHEVIGSSLLFVHDHSSRASVWMIDFAKTTPVSDASRLRHNIPWAEGSREDGYLIGLTSLITSLSQAISVASWQQEHSCGEDGSVA